MVVAVFVVVLVELAVVVHVEEEITGEGLVVDICQQDPFAFTFTDSRLSTMEYFLSVAVWTFFDGWTCCENAQVAVLIFRAIYRAI